MVLRSSNGERLADLVLCGYPVLELTVYARFDGQEGTVAFRSSAVMDLHSLLA